MHTRGIPETIAEAQPIVHSIGQHTPNDPVPAHWPHSQIVAIAKVVDHQTELIDTLLERCDKLKAKILELENAQQPRRGPGRPPKNTTPVAE